MGTLRMTPMNVGPSNGTPILRQAGVSKSLATTTATSNTTLPAGSYQFLRLVADEVIMVTLGIAGVTAVVETSFPLMPNIPEYIPVDGNTHIAGIELI